MKVRWISVIIAVMMMISAFAVPALADSFTNTINTFKNSEQVKPFFKSAYGYAVFPTIGKGGFVIGGAFGKGQVYRHGKVTGTSSVVKGSIGFQAGGQAFSQMVFFQDQRAYKEFTSGEFSFKADVSAVAITAGAQAQAGTKGGATAGASAGPATGEQAARGYTNGMAVFVHAKGGLMYEASVGGQKFNFTPL